MSREPCLARLVTREGQRGRCVGVEHVPELVRLGEENVRRDDASLLESLDPAGVPCLVFRCGDGHLGWAEAGPYDVIHVGAAAPSIPPALLDQLAPGGRMLIPVGEKGKMQTLKVVDRGQDGKEASGNSTKFNLLKLALERP
ncbi:protein-L-isoaspartate O-methyltransferase [Baffinella frigidus]|nr:protein-L-isoaspartate O-methyltransferase [Cryptophyta sp. CCMP2293]